MFRLEFPSGDPLLLPPDLSVLIGRGEECDLRLDDPAASRAHCRVISSGGKVALTDVGSRWGTFVNGQQVQSCDLQPGDRITVGETVLRLQAESDPAATTLARQSELIRPDAIETIAPKSADDFAAAVPEFLLDVPSNQANVWRGDVIGKATGAELPLKLLAADQFLLGQTFHRYRVQQTLAATSSDSSSTSKTLPPVDRPRSRFFSLHSLPAKSTGNALNAPPKRCSANDIRISWNSTTQATKTDTVLRSLNWWTEFPQSI